MTIDEFFDELAKRKELKWEKLRGRDIRCHNKEYIIYLNTLCCPITAIAPRRTTISQWKSAAKDLQLSSKDARKLANAADSRYASLRKRMLAACRLGADEWSGL